MNKLTHEERLAVMRILQDIILADNKIDRREEMLFDEVAEELELGKDIRQEVEKQNSLLALTLIHDFTPNQKETFAKLMGRMIVVDEDINYNEVRIYNVVNEFCGIHVDFRMDEYPEYTRS